MGMFLTPPPAPAAIIIVDDAGGLVRPYEAAARRYAAERRKVEIRGSCRSACTLALSVPNVCVAPGAVVKWHQAYAVETGETMPDVTKSMLAQLPPAVRWAVAGKIRKYYSPEATLSYVQLVQLGVPSCPALTASIMRIR